VSDRPADGDPSTLPDGVIDCHVHTAPDLIDRYESDLQLAHEAVQAGMDGVVVKSHVVPTAGRVDLVNEAIGEEILFGGIALNGSVGGLNTDAVETALELGGRIVWLPTAWSQNHASQARATGIERVIGQRVPDEGEDIRVAQDGEVTPATRAVIDLADSYDATVGTGHAGPEEIGPVVEACADAGVTCLVNHPFFQVVDLSIDEQVALAERGAIMEYCAYSVQSTEGHTIGRVAAGIERVGADNCLLATDFGQSSNPPVPGLAGFHEAIVEAGIGREMADRLVTATPAEVLGLS